MARLFVFGIGGTGSRVLKSLTMLLASGLRAGNFEIVPVLIDPHKDLKELNDCKTLLKLYSEINKNINYVADENEGFFKSKITTLTSIAPSSGMKDDYEFDERHDISFAQFLDLAQLPSHSATTDLLSLLYSEENFRKSLAVGFKGNPNVGSVVLNYLKETPGFKAFETAFGNEDRIFIISSIFGGTGASGFPLLLKNFRNHSNAKISHSQIGGLTVMPYFKLSELTDNGSGVKSDIDSKNFLTKTKAALTYYTRQEFSQLYNSLYYIGDPDAQNRPYENNEKDQPNKAHIVEVLGALSVIHFAKNNSNNRGEVYEYSLKEDKPNIDFTSIGDETRELIGSHLTSFLLFTQLHLSVMERNSLPFRKVCQFNEAFFSQAFFRSISDFIKNYFLKWLNEMNENERSLTMFNNGSSKSFRTLIKGYESEKKALEGIMNKPFDLSDLWLNMALAEKKFKNLNGSNKKNLQYFLMCRKAIEKSLASHVYF